MTSRFNHSLLLALICLVHAPTVSAWSLEDRFPEGIAHPPEADARLNQWYREARYGALVCFGPYSVAAGEFQGTVPTHPYAEWIQMNAKIPADVYRRELVEPLNPQDFDADEWAMHFKRAGLRYVVLTAKFHDGFALYDSKVSDYDIIDATPFKRDIIKEVSESCHRQGLKFGIYYSQAYDWDEPDAPFPPGRGRVQEIHPGLPDDFEPEMDRYLESKAYPQIEELVKHYEIDLIWFDTPVMMNDARAQRFVDIVRAHRPDCVISSRLLLGNRRPVEPAHLKLVDYISLADKQIPDKKLPLTFECPDSVSSSYGYKVHGKHRYHSNQELMERFVHAVCAGGNYLLNCGIMANGQIDPKAIERYEMIGSWLQHSGESLIGTVANPFSERPAWGDVSMSPSTETLYLHLLYPPTTSEIRLEGLSPVVKDLSLLAHPAAKLKFEQAGESLQVSIPPELLNPLNTVIKVQLKSPLLHK